MSLHVKDNNGSIIVLKKTGSSHGVSRNVDVANHQGHLTNFQINNNVSQCPLYHRAASKSLNKIATSK